MCAYVQVLPSIHLVREEEVGMGISWRVMKVLSKKKSKRSANSHSKLENVTFIIIFKLSCDLENGPRLSEMV